jgi:4-amino-4-deoxy-L-arabinose transferase-like glycosyltransferase
LAVFFGSAVLLALPLLRAEPSKAVNSRFFLICACLGVATLTKGLVPVALAIPFVWFLRRFWRKWWLTFAAGAVVALPWYVAVYVRNGSPFVEDFFVKHHLERLYSASLQHVQPWFYYFPVLLAGVFPWTPLFAFFLKRTTVWDERRRFLTSIIAFGFLFFSVSLNKLPGYLLPLLPALFALLGAEFERMPLLQVSRWWLVPSACLIGIIPVLVSVLPASLANGRVSMAAIHIGRTEWFYILLPLAAVVLARRSWAGTVLVLCVVLAGIYLKLEIFRTLDEKVSARGLWREINAKSDLLCDAGTNREWLYGIEFYRGAAIPFCGDGRGFKYEIRSEGRSRPIVLKIGD